MRRVLAIACATVLVATGSARADALGDAADWLVRTAPSLMSPAKTQATPPAPRSCRLPPLPSSVDGANKACLAVAGVLAAQRGDTLTLRMDDGSRKTFTDKDPSGETGYGYALVDFDAAQHLFVVADKGRDTTSYTIVDGRTGSSTETGGREPFVSPGGLWRFDVDRDMGTYVLVASAEPAAPVWDAATTKTDTNGLDVVGWRSDHVLELTRRGKRLALVRGADGRWSIDETPSLPQVEAKSAARKGMAKDVARCGIEGDFNQADVPVAEDACRARLGELARTADGTLTLQLSNGTTATFVDTRYEEGKPAPAFYLSSYVVYYSRAAHVFVLRQEKTGNGDGREGAVFRTVDSRDGATRAFATYPYVSPDGAVALEIATAGTMRLDDLADPARDAIWRSATAPADAVSPHTVFLGWSDARSARVLIDDARVLALSRDEAKAWSAATTPLVKAFDASGTGCTLPKEPDEKAEALCLATIPDIATRNGEVLTLKLEDGGTTREVSRSHESGNMAKRHLVGYDPTHHQFIIYAGFYEEYAWSIVDSISGENTGLGGGPMFSPDRSSFLVLTYPYGEGLSDIEIYANGPYPTVAWTYEPPKGDKPPAEADLVGWLDENHLKLKIDKKTVVVARDAGGPWHLVPSKKPTAAKSSPTVAKSPVVAKDAAVAR